MSGVQKPEIGPARARPRRQQALDAVVRRLSKLPRPECDYVVTSSVPVLMRDGVELLADVYEPAGQPRGTLLVRTPYGRAGVIGYLLARRLAKQLG